jgi:soluble lytic murein transglycosylase-like protein
MPNRFDMPSQALAPGLDPMLARAWSASVPSAVPQPFRPVAIPVAQPIQSEMPVSYANATQAAVEPPPPAEQLPDPVQLATALDMPSGKSRKGPKDFTPIQQLIVDRARAMGVDPAIALAQAERESSFYPDAKGGAGEYGLFQIHPKTAPILGITKANGFDPLTNTNAGLTYFQMMMDVTGGDPVEALRAYNAGPGNWRKGRIPARTLDYSADIMRRAEKYRANLR